MDEFDALLKAGGGYTGKGKRTGSPGHYRYTYGEGIPGTPKGKLRERSSEWNKKYSIATGNDIDEEEVAINAVRDVFRSYGSPGLKHLSSRLLAEAHDVLAGHLEPYPKTKRAMASYNRSMKEAAIIDKVLKKRHGKKAKGKARFVEHPIGSSAMGYGHREGPSWVRGDIAQAGKSKTRKSVNHTMTDPVEVEKLTKGLHEFHISPGQKGTKLPDTYLQDYLDAFIEEAYEHEYEEDRHRAPRLEGGDPYMYLARCVYNELLVFAVHNSNLLRAIKKFSINHPKYILGRLNFMNLCRVNSENYEAERQGQVGGYHPEKVEPLSQQSPPGFTRSMDSVAGAVQREEQEHKIRGGSGVFSDGPEMVTLRDDGIDPFVELKKSIDAQPDALGRRFVLDQNQPVHPTTNHNCPIHGLGDITKSQNLANLYVQCSCPE